MHGEQFALLAFEAAVMAVILLTLFRARTLLGLTPLYVVLGGFQYLEATLPLRVTIAPGFELHPGSSVFFTATLVTVLLIYVKEDAIEARKLVYGLVLANAAVVIVSLLVSWHLAIPGSSSLHMTQDDFLLGAWIAVVGTTLLLIDVLGIILLYEYISRFIARPFLRFYLSLVVICAFDQVFFSVLVRGTRAGLGAAIVAGVVGKLVAALFYSIIYFVYLRFVEPQIAAVGTGDVADVFQALTYRQKYEQARQRMVRDALTGLFNRGYFDEALPMALARAERYGEALSLLIIDTDKFKRINDEFSHMEGDRVLRLIAQTLSEHVRATDVPCRYGGDEFVVLLSRADVDAASAFAERFRAGLADHCRAASPPLASGAVTTTIGIATYPADAEASTSEGIVRLADRRLYAGKHAGRDRAVKGLATQQP
jgi:diguanylate cyclase (GGDEF)-like protein